MLGCLTLVMGHEAMEGLAARTAAGLPRRHGPTLRSGRSSTERGKGEAPRPPHTDDGAVISQQSPWPVSPPEVAAGILHGANRVDIWRKLDSPGANT